MFQRGRVQFLFFTWQQEMYVFDVDVDVDVDVDSCSFLLLTD